MRCTKRPSSKTAQLDALDLAWVDADLAEPDALEAAFAGADVVFHCAAAVSIRREVEPWLVAANVTGTEHVIGAVRAAGVKRLVHCSSAVAVGLSTDGQPCTEDADWNFAEFGLDDGYAITKRQAEERVVAAIGEGLDAVIVNPGFMFGAYDIKPSSGALIHEVNKRWVLPCTPGTNSFVDVRDVCAGMVAAWERGETGERYILAGHNLTYAEIFARVAAVAGVDKPRVNVPRALARFVGWAGDLQERFSGSQSSMGVNSNAIGWAYCDRFIFSSAKAAAALGYSYRPVEDGIAAALKWFRDTGRLP